MVIFICNIPFLFCAAKLAVLSIVALCQERNDEIAEEKSEGYEMESIQAKDDIKNAEMDLSAEKENKKISSDKKEKPKSKWAKKLH